MQSHATPAATAGRHRPKTFTVFAAAFAAGAVLAYGVNRVVDVHVIQIEPQVESEPIFVALRSMPQGSPITVWDVALKDWPKAMLPTTALRADASLDGMVLRHPVREGQPLLSVQLVRDGAAAFGSSLASLPTAAPPPEQFLAATPAERAATPHPIPPVGDTRGVVESTPIAAVVEPPVVAQPPVVSEPPADDVPAAAAAVTHDLTTDDVPVQPTVASDSSPAEEPAPAGRPSLITTFLAPASTDVDEPRAGPGIASPPGDTPTLVTADAALPSPTPTEAARPVALGHAPAAPLVAPVPALPSTDLEGSLVHAGRGRSASVTSPASILDRTAAAEPPVARPTMPRHHLVIPERIALAADASFTQQRAEPRAAPVVDRSARVAPPSRDASGAGTAAADRTGMRKTPAAKAAGRKTQAAAPQPASRPQSSQARGLSGWLPYVSGGDRQR